MKKAFIVIGFLVLAVGARAQTGFPLYGSFETSQVDAVNRQNLNTHFSIPIYSGTGRGLGLNFAVPYDALVWGISSGAWVGGNGWLTGYVVGTSGRTLTNTFTECGGVRTPVTTITNYSYMEPDKTIHLFPALYYNSGGCGGPSSQLTGYASDGSGYFMNATNNMAFPTVYSPSGTSFTSLTSAPQSEDTNGNYISGKPITGGVETDWTDSAGRTALKIIVNGTPYITSIQYEYQDTTGTYQTITLTYQTFSVKTNFGCSGIVEYTGTQSLPVSASFPNGTSYTFAYEATPGNSGYITGRVSKVTLPNGGYVQYQYGATNDGINCADGTITSLTRTVYDGTNTNVWQFSRAPSGSNWLMTETAPQMPYDSAANQSTYLFNAVGQELTEKLYQGSTSGALLRTINATWATNLSPATRTTILEDNSTQSEIETNYDSNGNLLSLKEHDYGTGAPGSILRTTTYTHLNTSAYITANIIDRVTEKSIADSTGTTQYVEDTAYDGSALSPCPTGVVQHDDGNYGCSITTRGNPTSVTTYANASTKAGAVAKNKHYDMFGNVVLADADCCQSMSWIFSATTEYSSPDSVVSGLSTGTHTTTNYTYNSYTGQIASVTDPNTQMTSFVYDSTRRLTTTTRPDSAQIVRSYNDTLHTISASSPILGTAIFKRTEYLDGLGRTTQTSIFDASSNLYSTTQMQYDGLDRPYNISNPFTSSAQYWTEIAYDALGRKSKVILPDSSQTAFAYSTSSVTQTDSAGHQRKMQTDGLNHLSVVYEPDPTNGNSLTLQSHYAYTVLGNLASLTQGSQTRTYSYDGMGRLTSHALPESGTTSFQYSTYNQISQRTDARGVITTYTYDTMNRPYQIIYNVGTTGVPATPTVTYAFGTNASQLNNGRLLSITDGLGTVTNTYDNLARATQVQHVINGTTYTIGYGYNLAGAVTSLTYPSGRVVQPAYDAIGRLSSLANGTTTYASSFIYNSAFAPTNFTMGNGVAVTAGYSPDRLQLSSLKYVGGSTVFSTTYGYTQNGGNNGQITGITDAVDSGRSIAYTYDALNRLSTAVTTGSTNYPAWGMSFTYDRYGNRTAQTVTAGTAPSNSVVVSATTNHITTSGYAYDLNGNMTNDAVNTIGYDGENRLVSSSGSAGSGTYSYRASGLRAVKVSGGVTTVYLFDGNRDIAEYTNGTLANEYVYLGNKVIASHLSGVLYYQASDHQSIRVNLNTSGGIAAQKGQYSFGEDWYPSSLTNRHFTNYERDSESSNDNALHRFYVNRLGRFSANDPIPGGGQNPQRFNFYSYVHNDPVNRLDPTGRDDNDEGGEGDFRGDYVACLIAEDGPCIFDPWWPGPEGGSTGGDCSSDSADGGSCPTDPTPPPPPPTPSCTAELHYRPVANTHGIANHAFWIVNDSIQNWTLEGGPDHGALFSVLGLSHLDSWAIPQGDPPHFAADTPETLIWDSFDGGGNTCTGVAVMISFTKTFVQGKIRYNPFFGPNSNSFAYTLSEYGSFSPPFPPPRTPGWYLSVP